MGPLSHAVGTPKLSTNTAITRQKVATATVTKGRRKMASAHATATYLITHPRATHNKEPKTQTMRTNLSVANASVGKREGEALALERSS